ncbi:MAG TPA: Lrp/AsnC family transcriptional regulator [Gammaproteobacteria bacterium]
MNFDETDLNILRLLRNNARISNKSLAAKTGIAPSTCLGRVRRLERSGVIAGYHAELNPVAVGVRIQAMVGIRMVRHVRADVDAFHAHAMAQKETVAVYHVAGADDFLVHVAARDTEHLRQIVLYAFTERPEVAHIETRLIFEQARTGGFPLYTGEEAGSVTG